MHACIRSFAAVVVLLVAWLAMGRAVARADDWPQWRGPARNGIAADSRPLAERWRGGLPKLWDSENIPADDDGGHGSVVVAGGRVYMGVVWHTAVPSQSRVIDDQVMRALGYQSVASWPKETVEKMERDIRALDPALSGAAFEQYVSQWISQNLDAKKQQTAAGYVRNRFRKRGEAIPLGVYDKLLTVSKKAFANERALADWLDEQGISGNVKKEILAAVPPTIRVAEDVVLCLDLASGKTVWKFRSPGEAVGRMASSTPCVADGRVYALGSAHCYAVDAADGRLVWSAPLAARGPASSPLAVDGRLVINAGRLTALDAKTGKELWSQPKAGGGNSSPVAWQSEGTTTIIVNGRGVLSGVDLGTGNVVWSTPAGGDSTPAIVGNKLAVQTNKPEIGILAGTLSKGGFSRLWNVAQDPLRSQSSLLLIGDHLYLTDDNVHQCIEWATGRPCWKKSVGSSAITSPAFADGKIFLVTSGGSMLVMMEPSPLRHTELGKARVTALACPSPAIADGKLLLRGRKGISCYSLEEDQRASR